MTTSASDRIRVSLSLPSRPPNSMTTDSLPAFMAAWNFGSPRRVLSGREAASTLITRAPARARRRPTRGPAHRAEKSATTTPVMDDSGGAEPIRVAVIPWTVPAGGGVPW